MFRSLLLIALAALCVAPAPAAFAQPTTRPHARATTRKAAQQIAAAEESVRKGDLADAATHYEKALGLDPGDLDARVKYGDVLHDLARSDPAYFGRDRQ